MRKKHTLIGVGSIVIAGGLLLSVYLLFGDGILRFWVHSQADKGNWGNIRWYISKNTEDISQYTDVGIPDKQGYYLLTKAVSQDNYFAVVFLLQSGANPNVFDPFGRFPLGLAAVNCNRFIFRLLIEHGADVNIARTELTFPVRYKFGTSDRASSIIYERGASDVSILKDAKDYGAILTPKMGDGYSSHPIHYAAANSFDDPACVAFFESNGIPIDLKDKHGSTPLDIAINAGNKKVADYIRKRGGFAAVPAEGSIRDE